MIRFLFLSNIFLLFLNNTYSQSITTGQYGPYDYYYDNNPDSLYYINTNYSSIVYQLDINNDGVFDFDIGASYSSSGGGTLNYVSISPKNNNKVSFSYIDTCYAWDSSSIVLTNMVYPHTIGEVIDSNLIWENLLFLIGSRYTPSYSGYGCAFGTFDSISRYVGVKVFCGIDTLYGWIKLKNVTRGLPSGFTIEEYACNKSSAVIEEIPNNENFSVYPNPVNGLLSVKVDKISQGMVLNLYTIFGQQIIKEEIQQNLTRIDLSKLSSGFYILILTDGDNQYQQKIIID